MNQTQSSSFGIYETVRILVPGFYFSSLFAFLYQLFILEYLPFHLESGHIFILFIFLSLVSGLTMYAKETPKRRRAFADNQPSAFLQDIARRHSSTQTLSDSEARQLYFYILNHFIPPTFHDKIFFFGTVYHIMIHIRRTSFWFAILSLSCLLLRISMGYPLAQLGGLIAFCTLVWLVYFLNVTYNKADRKMQENYQDQKVWLQMNEDLIKDLLCKYDLSKKGSKE